MGCVWAAMGPVIASRTVRASSEIAPVQVRQLRPSSERRSPPQAQTESQPHCAWKSIYGLGIPIRWINLTAGGRVINLKVTARQTPHT